MGTIRLGKRTDGRSPKINEFVPLAELDDIVFGGWDIFEEDCYAAARTAGVLEPALLDQVRGELEAIKPMPAVFDQRYVKRLYGPERQEGQEQEGPRRAADRRHPRVQAEARLRSPGDGLVRQHRGLHEGGRRCTQSLAAFEKGLEASDDAIPSSMVYAYAALREGMPFANAAPNLTADIPAMLELAAQTKSPLAGNDMKTGQTLIKTIIAPGLKARLIGVRGLVLDQHPRQPRRRSAGRSGVVQDQGREQEVGARLHLPAAPLSRSSTRISAHVVRINYYPPRGDNKEGWDNIDIVGWLGYPMQLKINFLCRDQHPGGADRARLGAVPRPGQARRACPASRNGCRSTSRRRCMRQEVYPEHDLFIQLMKLKNTLRCT